MCKQQVVVARDFGGELLDTYQLQYLDASALGDFFAALVVRDSFDLRGLCSSVHSTSAAIKEVIVLFCFYTRMYLM